MLTFCRCPHSNYSASVFVIRTDVVTSVVAAIKYDTITYDEVLAQHLAVMDTTATSLSMDNHLPIVLFALKDPENIYRVVMGEEIGTIVKEEK